MLTKGHLLNSQKTKALRHSSPKGKRFTSGAFPLIKMGEAAFRPKRFPL